MADIVGDVVIYKRKTYKIHTRLYSGVKEIKFKRHPGREFKDVDLM